MQSPAPHTDNRQSANLIEQRLQLLNTIREIVDSELERRESQKRMHKDVHPDLATRLRRICRNVGECVMRAFGA
ncbi:MAG: hypothetical protein PUF55_02215 [Bacteroidales bacterium]|nr:hypothetical protein [Bacteroidales bacterium]